eukprot:CAMPEP_0119533480 /NCGR_PEP_ID=MMETSP1344-20130328/46872_1 /TAXON_ID=236787 /ORGANISM="Florenciella parvula, Strain CCMP2471" /LENGTH=66 /DNA_ID=CAMNT_0007574383 /DNA_START=12 /DNA_END=209 /DNA_ORIENTATION=-
MNTASWSVTATASSSCAYRVEGVGVGTGTGAPAAAASRTSGSRTHLGEIGRDPVEADALGDRVVSV